MTEFRLSSSNEIKALKSDSHSYSSVSKQEPFKDLFHFNAHKTPVKIKEVEPKFMTTAIQGQVEIDAIDDTFKGPASLNITTGMLRYGPLTRPQLDELRAADSLFGLKFRPDAHMVDQAIWYGCGRTALVMREASDVDRYFVDLQTTLTAMH